MATKTTTNNKDSEQSVLHPRDTQLLQQTMQSSLNEKHQRSVLVFKWDELQQLQRLFNKL